MTLEESEKSLEELLDEASSVSIEEHVTGKDKKFLKKINKIKGGLQTTLLFATGTLPAALVAHALSGPETSSTTLEIATFGTMAIGFAAGYTGLRNSLARKLRKGRSRLAGKITKYYNKLIEWPEVPAAVVAGYTYVHWAGFFLSSRTISDVITGLDRTALSTELSTLFGALAGMVTYTAFSLAGRALHTDTMSAAYHTAAASYYKDREKYDGAILSIKKLLSLPHSVEKEARLLIQLGDIHYLNKSYEDASKTYIQALNVMQRQTGGTGYSDPIAGLLSLGNIEARDVPSLIGAAAKATMKGDFAEAASHLEKAVVMEPRKRIPHRARAAFYKTLGADAASNLEMRIYEELVYQDPTLSFILVGEARNEVLIPTTQQDLASDIILKRNKSREELEQEYRDILKLKQGLGRSVSNVLSFRKRGAYYSMAMAVESSTTYLDAVKFGNYTLADVEQAIDLLVDVQVFLMSMHAEGKTNLADVVNQATYTTIDGETIPNHDNTGSIYYINRLKDVFYGQVKKYNGEEFIPSFEEALERGENVLNRRLRRLHGKPYSDFNLRNILKDPLSKIDWEKLRLLPEHLELVNLLEFEYSYLTESQRGSLNERYIKRFQKKAAAANLQADIDKQEFQLDNEFGGVVRHLELVGYRTRDSKSSEHPYISERARVFHYNKAISHLENILQNLEVSDNDKEELGAMKSALEQSAILARDTQMSLEQNISREHISTPDKLSIKAKVALAMAGTLLVAVTVVGSVSYRNNLIPILNRQFRDYSDILTVISTQGTFPNQENKIYAINTRTGESVEVANADYSEVDRSPLHHQLVFEYSGLLAVYDFRNGSLSFLSDDGRFDRGVFSPSGLKIALELNEPFLSDNMHEIYLADSDGFGLGKATPLPNSFGPVWAPDSKKFAFLSYNELDERGHPNEFRAYMNIISVNEDISKIKLWQGPFVGNDYDTDLAWSPSGLLAFSRKDPMAYELHIADFAGANTSPSLVYQSKDRILGPVWLSESEIAFYLQDSATGVDKQITILDISTLEQFVIANASRPLAFSVGRLMLYYCGDDVCSFDISTKQRRNLTNSPGINDYRFAFSADGKNVYTVSAHNRVSNVFQMKPDGSDRRQLTQNEDAAINYELVTP